MAILKPKTNEEKQDIGGGYSQGGAFKQHEEVLLDQNTHGGGTPFRWICSNCDLEFPSGSPRSVVTLTPTGFEHFDGVDTTVAYVEPTIVSGDANNVIVAGGDSGAFLDCSDILGCVNVDGTTITGSGTPGSPFTASCITTFNSGPTSTVSDQTYGEEDIVCGETVHFWSTDSTIRFDVTSGALGIALDADVELASTQAGILNTLQRINGDGLYNPAPQADGVTITGAGTSGSPFVAVQQTIVSADSGNLITAGGDDGAYIDVTTIATELDVTVQDSGSIDFSISGAGPSGDPWLLGGVVKYSTDAGNLAQAGTDGGIFVPNASGIVDGVSDEGTISGVPNTVSGVNKAKYIWDVDTSTGDIDLSSISTITNVNDGAELIFRNTGEYNILYDQNINGNTVTYTIQGIGILRLLYDGNTTNFEIA